MGHSNGDQWSACGRECWVSILAMHNKSRFLGSTIVGNAILVAEVEECNDVSNSIGIKPAILLTTRHNCLLTESERTSIGLKVSEGRTGVDRSDEIPVAE